MNIKSITQKFYELKLNVYIIILKITKFGL